MDYEVVFVRGSGQERYKSEEYLSLKEAIGERFKWSGQTYNLTDLDYWAQGINLRTGLGAFVSAGRSLSYGKSVKSGVENLKTYYGEKLRNCPSVKFVLVGYSQGAQVVGTTMRDFTSESIEYVALFGDPELYLPESRDFAACRGESLSEYRRDVPDCRVETGVLGARIPYAPVGFEGKVGAWCNEGDVVCGSGYD